MNIKSLSITNRAREILEHDTNLSIFIEKEKEKFPFPPCFVPNSLEIRLDNVLIVTLDIVRGQVLDFKENEHKNKASEIIDWRFDGECGLFIISNNTIINRVEQLKIFRNIESSKFIKL